MNSSDDSDDSKPIRDIKKEEMDMGTLMKP